MGQKPNNQFRVNHFTRVKYVCVCTWLVGANALLRHTLERLNISTAPGWVGGGQTNRVGHFGMGGVERGGCALE